MANKASESAGSQYTQPKMRQKLKQQLQAGSQGGKPGQWSARKSQLLAQQYKAAGGGYTGAKSAPQKSLDRWTDEQWTTSDGKKAQKGDTTDRYLPKEAWESLPDDQKQKTRAQKQAGSKAGKQYVSNTAAAQKSRKKATAPKKAAAKKVTPKKAASKAPSPKAAGAKTNSSKAASKKSASQKAAWKKTTSKKKTSKKTTSKKAASKKSTAKKTVASRQKIDRPRNKRS